MRALGTVVNFRQYGSVAALERPARLTASPLANPFRQRDVGGERGVTLPHYRRWLGRQIQTGTRRS